jgi:hypothetical protein
VGGPAKFEPFIKDYLKARGLRPPLGGRVGQQGAGRAARGAGKRPNRPCASERLTPSPRPARPPPSPLPQHFAFKTLTSGEFKDYFSSYFKDTPAIKKIDWWAGLGEGEARMPSGCLGRPSVPVPHPLHPFTPHLPPPTGTRGCTRPACRRSATLMTRASPPRPTSSRSSGTRVRPQGRARGAGGAGALPLPSVKRHDAASAVQALSQPANPSCRLPSPPAAPSGRHGRRCRPTRGRQQ